MARTPAQPRPDGDPLKDGLKHNPFAALRPRSSEAPTTTPAEPTGDATTSVPERTPSRSPSSASPSPVSSPVSSPAASSPASPAASRSAARVVVRRERKGHGGKAVTIAEGPGLADQDLATLAREAARALGAGARVEDGALVVQGEQTERLVAWLGTRGFGTISRGN